MKKNNLQPFLSAGKYLSGCTFILNISLTLILGYNSVLNINAQIIYTSDFNVVPKNVEDYKLKEQWMEVSATVSDPAIKAKATLGKYGTVDIANTDNPSHGMLLSVENSGKLKNWTAGLNSGLLAIKNSETNLGKLTISFDHSVSSVRPVVVRIESFDANKKRTGGLESSVYPATTDFFLRSTIDLFGMKPFGDGKFNPQDPFVNFSFVIGEKQITGASEENQELRIDNFAYSAPAYYVSPSGKNTNDGRTEKTAFADPQVALNIARPGDII